MSIALCIQCGITFSQDLHAFDAPRQATTSEDGNLDFSRRNAPLLVLPGIEFIFFSN